ncbi:MAG: hypothetical protein HQL59_10420, partial [Magnetococcales bacterium]|nr:hypothetical protein [Magnetococcales bacterium]
MSLKRALSRLPPTSIFPALLPLSRHTALAEERIDTIFGSLPLSRGRTPTGEDAREGRERIERAFREHRSLAGIERRLLNRVPWYLFEPREDGTTLADDPAFCLAWRDWFDHNPSSSTLLLLLH